MCEYFTSVVSAVAAHTELVRTLTTAPPAKRQPASSTGNLIKIMSLLHYITHQWQLILSGSAINSPETSPGKLYAFLSLEIFHFPLFFSAFPGFIIYSAHLSLLFYFSLAFLPGMLRSLPFSPTLITVLLIQHIPIIWKMREWSPSSTLKWIHAVF